MVFSTYNNDFLHVLEIAMLIILESVFFNVRFVFLSYKVVNSSVMSTSICMVPRFPNMQDQRLLRLRWCSVHDGVTKISCTILAEKEAIPSHMNLGHPATFRLTKMQDQKSLTLHWRSRSGWGRECVSLVLHTEGCQYFIYDDFWPVAT